MRIFTFFIFFILSSSCVKHNLHKVERRFKKDILNKNKFLVVNEEVDKDELTITILKNFNKDSVKQKEIEFEYLNNQLIDIDIYRFKNEVFKRWGYYENGNRKDKWRNKSGWIHPQKVRHIEWYENGKLESISKEDRLLLDKFVMRDESGLLEMKARTLYNPFNGHRISFLRKHMKTEC